MPSLLSIIYTLLMIPSTVVLPNISPKFYIQFVQLDQVDQNQSLMPPVKNGNILHEQKFYQMYNSHKRLNIQRKHDK